MQRHSASHKDTEEHAVMGLDNSSPPRAKKKKEKAKKDASKKEKKHRKRHRDKVAILIMLMPLCHYACLPDLFSPLECNALWAWCLSYRQKSGSNPAEGK